MTPLLGYCAFALFLAVGGPRPAPIPVVYVPLVYSESELYRDVSQSFQSPRNCSGRKPRRIFEPDGTATTIHELLGDDVKAILVHYYQQPAWQNMAVVTDYIDRIVDAKSGTEFLMSAPNWAEARTVEILAEVEFANGQRRRIEFANGIAHIEDVSGCQWWGRYLGGDRAKWIVRKGTTDDGWR